MCEDLLRKEKAKLFKYGFISSDISIGLDYILKRKKIPEEYKENIQEGIKFLEDAINGNTLITGEKDSNFHPTSEGLKAYGIVIDLLKDKEVYGEFNSGKEIENTLLKMKNSLEKSLKGEKENIEFTKKFFSDFSKKMLKELQSTFKNEAYFS